MTYNKAISQLEDLKKDAQSHISDDEPLRFVIDIL